MWTRSNTKNSRTGCEEVSIITAEKILLNHSLLVLSPSLPSYRRALYLHVVSTKHLRAIPDYSCNIFTLLYELTESAQFTMLLLHQWSYQPWSRCQARSPKSNVCYFLPWVGLSIWIWETQIVSHKTARFELKTFFYRSTVLLLTPTKVVTT